MGRICIPDAEYKERVKKAAAILQRDGFDAMIVNGNEADYANPRYFSGFWPLFERAGVAISASGDAALLVGPESAIFGADRNKLDKIFVLKAYREGADPSYPELKADEFPDVFKALGITGKKLRIAVASLLDTSVVIYNAIKEAFPEAEIVDAGYIMTELRQIKSENELACLREGYRIAQLATDAVIAEIKPGMTELQAVGIAQRCVYENGAEYEGLPMYVFSEASTR
ncbi:MAG: aminopeptidase P family protein, partial [Lachnospiraceae bacterium]|nr:aminopeptidase P family protein [Candidatus Darwinimomas equi]